MDSLFESKMESLSASDQMSGEEQTLSFSETSSVESGLTLEFDDDLYNDYNYCN
eukprot:Awhi_evm1s483